MTIKTRNRLNIALCIFSAAYMLLTLTVFTVKAITKTLSFAPFEQFIPQDTFILFRYSPYCVTAVVFMQMAFVIADTYILLRGFEKNQSAEVVYFSIFLFAVLADTTRIWIPLLNLAETFSALYLFLGNITLFSRLLIPLSILAIILFSGTEQRLNLERNIFILLLVSFFFAEFIPLNSAVRCKNFTIDFSYKKMLVITTVIIMIISVVSMFFINKKQFYSQKTTIGFALICAGSLLFETASNIFFAVLCAAFNGAGSILFLKTLHEQYLWDD